jgi:hypothetical protein
MKILFLLVLLRGPVFANDSLPNRESLFAALRAFHAETAEANAEPLNIVSGRAWQHLLPSVGITLGKPTIGFSIGQFLNFREQKALRTAEKAKILRGSNLNFRADSFALVAQLERIDNARDALPSLAAAERTANARFEIEKELNAKGLLPAPFGWLDAQAANLRSGEAVRIKLEEINLLEIDARKLAKY